MQKILSEVPDLGRVMTCGGCEDVHVAVGRMSFRLPKEMFLALAGMVNEAASRLQAPEDGLFSVTFEDGVPSFAPIREG